MVSENVIAFALLLVYPFICLPILFLAHQHFLLHLGMESMKNAN